MRTNLTKKEIINSIYMQLGYSKKICETLLDDFFDILLEQLIQNNKVKISGFGTFYLRIKQESIGRNPKTNEEAIINKRNVITFKASKELKKYINSEL